jgi:hypothetical protein
VLHRSSSDDDTITWVCDVCGKSRTSRLDYWPDKIHHACRPETQTLPTHPAVYCAPNGAGVCTRCEQFVGDAHLICSKPQAKRKGCCGGGKQPILTDLRKQ